MNVPDEEHLQEVMATGWNQSKVPVTGQLNEFRVEEERRLTDGKWETVYKGWAKPAVAGLHQPRSSSGTSLEKMAR